MEVSLSHASRALIVSAALVIVVAGMKYAAPLLVPFLLSVFIAVISFPLMSWLQQKGTTRIRANKRPGLPEISPWRSNPGRTEPIRT